MVHKVLLFNLKDPAKEGVLRDKTMELLPNIPGASNVTFRKAATDSNIQYHYLITVDLPSMDVHESYMVHEKHVEYSTQYFRPNISDVLIQFFE